MHVVHAFQTGGAERVIVNLTRHASADVQNFVCSLTEPHDLVGQIDTARVGFRCLRKKDGNDPKLVSRLAELIDEQEIDVVHAQGWGTYVESLLAAKWASKRRPAFVFAFHGKSLAEVEQGVPMRQRVAQRIANVFTDACVAAARHMAQEYAHNIWVSRGRVEVIPNGVDTDLYRPADGAQARAMFGLGADDFVIGFVGRFDPVKNLSGILHAFAWLPAAAASGKGVARLLMIGEGTERDNVQRTVRELGLSDRVVLAGPRSDIQLCMTAMDVYFQPSFYEGHSVTILEAMSSGLPVVSTRVGGTPEIVRAGETGLLHSAADIEAMAQSLQGLREQPQQRAAFGRAAREFVIEHFSVQSMVGNYESLYRRVLHIGERQCAA